MTLLIWYIIQQCISEDQKYQGALYKEKPSKKTLKISQADPHAPRKAYVEDAPDAETDNTISIVVAPPEAPAPPSITPAPPNVNVFDFLVTEDTPDASRTSLAPGDQRGMDYTPSVLDSDVGRRERVKIRDPGYEKHGFSYGTDPILSTHRKDRPKVEYFTPASKDLHRDLAEDTYERRERKSTDKKRKRLHVEELDLTAARRPSQDPEDVSMSDAPAPVLHSGLTGGLNRLLSKSKFPPSPDYTNGDPDPPSPLKRSKQISTSQTLIVRDRDRSRKPSTTSSALVKTRKRRTSDESRPRKKHHRHHEDSHHHRERSKRKAIEYNPSNADRYDEESQQLVVFSKSRAELFMSFITKGEESERGMSVHKALKRYHRESRGRDRREEDEKELWKGLRLRRNERGEVVIFF